MLTFDDVVGPFLHGPIVNTPHRRRELSSEVVADDVRTELVKGGPTGEQSLAVVRVSSATFYGACRWKVPMYETDPTIQSLHRTIRDSLNVWPQQSRRIG